MNMSEGVKNNLSNYEEGGRKYTPESRQKGVEQNVVTGYINNMTSLDMDGTDEMIEEAQGVSIGETRVINNHVDEYVKVTRTGQNQYNVESGTYERES